MNMQADPRIRDFSYPQFTAARKKNMGNESNKRFMSFKTCTKQERAVTWRNPAAETRPVLDSSSFVPAPTPPR